MSSLLEQAIVDAKALKEAALKNAENLVVEKYAREVKNTMHNLLEQEEVAIGVAPTEEEETELNSIAKQVPDAFLTEDEEKVIIDLDELDAHINEALQIDESSRIKAHSSNSARSGRESDVIAGGIDTEMTTSVTEEPNDENTEEGISLEEFQDIISEIEIENDLDVTPTPEEEEALMSLSDRGQSVDADDESLPEEGEEDGAVEDSDSYERSEDPTSSLEPEIRGVSPDQLQSLMVALSNYKSARETPVDLGQVAEAKVKIDAMPVSSGWSDPPEAELQHLEDMALAMLKDDEVAELVKEMEKIQKENKTLKTAASRVVKENKNLQKAVGMLRKKIQEVNISNAKLLYINQTLESVSLNERQKQGIVEAITKAGSVREAKIIYETLKTSSGGFKQERQTNTLSEAVSNRSSLLIAARQESRQNNEANSPFFDRMQKLAGLKQQT